MIDHNHVVWLSTACSVIMQLLLSTTNLHTACHCAHVQVMFMWWSQCTGGDLNVQVVVSMYRWWSQCTGGGLNVQVMVSMCRWSARRSQTALSKTYTYTTHTCSWYRQAHPDSTQPAHACRQTVHGPWTQHVCNGYTRCVSCHSILIYYTQLVPEWSIYPHVNKQDCATPTIEYCVRW